MVSGLLNKQVGGELKISEITVKARCGQVMQKMKANSLADLVRMAARLQPALIQFLDGRPTDLTYSLALERQCENPTTISPQLFLPERSFAWFVIGDKENRERSLGGEPACADRYCTKLKCGCKLLIINKIMVEATGVELITVLTST